LLQADGSGFAVLCFFSVCHREKPYVDDTFLGVEGLVGFLFLFVFGFAGWLSGL
jgi:hypothetical protein